MVILDIGAYKFYDVIHRRYEQHVLKGFYLILTLGLIMLGILSKFNFELINVLSIFRND